MSEWISVEERLPEEDELVIANFKDLYGNNVCIVRWDGIHSIVCRNVTHWMPLPESPSVTDTNVGGKEDV